MKCLAAFIEQEWRCWSVGAAIARRAWRRRHRFGNGCGQKAGSSCAVWERPACSVL